MHALLTTCTAKKALSRAMIPARDRYLGARIEAAAARAQHERIPLLFLSGVFGIIRAELPLPWYDHALQPYEVDGLIPMIADQFAVLEVSALTAMLREPGSPGWAPYHRLLIDGCRLAGVSLKIEQTDLE